MTLEEFDATPPWRWKRGYRYELINGILAVSPPADITQSGPNDYLGYELHKYKVEHPQGASLDFTTHEFYISTQTTRRVADRVIWAGLGRVPDPDQDQPTIVIEFVSPGKRSRIRDYETKRLEYAEIGVAEYWVIDRYRRQMTLYRRPNDKVPEQAYGEKQTYTTPLLPGFKLSLAKLFAVSEQLEKARGKGRQRKRPGA
jgi:Uma2 family endonuclease